MIGAESREMRMRIFLALLKGREFELEAVLKDCQTVYNFVAGDAKESQPLTPEQMKVVLGAQMGAFA